MSEPPENSPPAEEAPRNGLTRAQRRTQAFHRAKAENAQLRADNAVLEKSCRVLEENIQMLKEKLARFGRVNGGAENRMSA